MTKLIFVFGLAAWLALVSAASEMIPLRPNKPMLPGADKPQPAKGGTIQRNIIGGTLATSRDQFPYQGVLHIDLTYVCGCSLISKRYTLTAAHCVKGFSGFIMIYGVLNITSNPDNLRVVVKLRNNDTVMIHEYFNVTTFMNDVAVIKFPADITFNQFVQPIPLPRSVDTTTYAGVIATVSGWGAVNNQVARRNDLLSFTTVQVISNSACLRYYASGLLTHTAMCTVSSGASPMGTCLGDSGGPLVAMDPTGTKVQIGIVSFGPPGVCVGNHAEVFTRVSSVVSWILLKTGMRDRA